MCRSDLAGDPVSAVLDGSDHQGEEKGDLPGVGDRRPGERQLLRKFPRRHEHGGKKVSGGCEFYHAVCRK